MFIDFRIKLNKSTWVSCYVNWNESFTNHLNSLYNSFKMLLIFQLPEKKLLLVLVFELLFVLKYTLNGAFEVRTLISLPFSADGEDLHMFVGCSIVLVLLNLIWSKFNSQIIPRYPSASIQRMAISFSFSQMHSQVNKGNHLVKLFNHARSMVNSLTIFDDDFWLSNNSQLINSWDTSVPSSN